MTIRRLGPGDEAIVVQLGGERPTNSSNDPAMSFYRSVGGARPNEDGAMWEFDYRA